MRNNSIYRISFYPPYIRMDIPMAHRLLFLFAETPDESPHDFFHPGLTGFRLTENP